MAWNLRRDFHIDITASYGSLLLQSATEKWPRPTPPDMIAGDAMPLRLYFWEKDSSGLYVAADPGPDTVFVFSGRPAGAPSGSDLLFLTNDFTEIATGVWEGTLDLTPAEFQAHLEASPAGAKIILGELEVRDSIANTQRNSFQFDLTARPQVYNGEDSPVGLPTPDAWLEARRPAATLAESAPINGVLQCVFITILGTVTLDGNYKLIVTGVDLPAPIEVSFFATAGDDYSMIPALAISALEADPTISAAYTFAEAPTPSSGNVAMTRRHDGALDSTLNLALENIDSAGLTPVATATPWMGTAGTPGKLGQIIISPVSGIFMCTGELPYHWEVLAAI